MIYYPDKEIKDIGYSPMEVIGKKSYAVPEIKKMLGIGKASSYEFIKAEEIETIVIGNNVRVTKESFDKWFHSGDYLFENNEEVL